MIIYKRYRHGTKRGGQRYHVMRRYDKRIYEPIHLKHNCKYCGEEAYSNVCYDCKRKIRNEQVRLEMEREREREMKRNLSIVERRERGNERKKKYYHDNRDTILEKSKRLSEGKKLKTKLLTEMEPEEVLDVVNFKDINPRTRPLHRYYFK